MYILFILLEFTFFKLLINWINQTFPQSICTISVMSFLLAFPDQQNSPFQIRVLCQEAGSGLFQPNYLLFPQNCSDTQTFFPFAYTGAVVWHFKYTGFNFVRTLQWLFDLFVTILATSVAFSVCGQFDRKVWTFPKKSCESLQVYAFFLFREIILFMIGLMSVLFVIGPSLL